jgi:hypothetical protein
MCFNGSKVDRQAQRGRSFNFCRSNHMGSSAVRSVASVVSLWPIHFDCRDCIRTSSLPRSCLPIISGLIPTMRAIDDCGWRRLRPLMASVTDETAADSIRVATLFGVNGSSTTSYTETAARSHNVGFGIAACGAKRPFSWTWRLGFTFQAAGYTPNRCRRVATETSSEQHQNFSLRVGRRRFPTPTITIASERIDP